jgi:hypothetical protein
MGKPRDHKDAAQEIARDIADIAGQLASLQGEAHAWLRDPRRISITRMSLLSIYVRAGLEQ